MTAHLEEHLNTDSEKFLFGSPLERALRIISATSAFHVSAELMKKIASLFSEMYNLLTSLNLPVCEHKKKRVWCRNFKGVCR